jgi:hypothetical protein
MSSSNVELLQISFGVGLAVLVIAFALFARARDQRRKSRMTQMKADEGDLGSGFFIPLVSLGSYEKTPHGGSDHHGGSTVHGVHAAGHTAGHTHTADSGGHTAADAGHAAVSDGGASVVSHSGGH